MENKSLNIKNVSKQGEKVSLVGWSVFFVIIFFSFLEDYYLLNKEKFNVDNKTISQATIPIDNTNVQLSKSIPNANMPSTKNQIINYKNISNPIVISTFLNSSSTAQTKTTIIPTFSTPEIPINCLQNYSNTNNVATAIPVFLYHGEAPQYGDIPLPNFIDQMCALKEDGWKTITMNQFYDFMKRGITLPEKSFLLTFDDGRKDSYYKFDPVLKQLGFNAIMFVITGFSLPSPPPEKASTFYLSLNELKDMVASGRWEIESHGDQDHRIYNVPTSSSTPQNLILSNGYFLTNLFWLPNQNRLETEDEFKHRIAIDLSISKNILEKDFGKQVISFAYPFNDFGQDSVNFQTAKNILGNIVPSFYTFAFYQTSGAKNGGPLNYSNPSTYLIKRIEPDYRLSGQAFLNLVNSSMPKKLPYISNNFGPEWQGDWGNVTSNGSLSLKAKPNTTGAEATMNGSETWDDYSFATNVDWKRGQDISLFARNKSDNNLVECIFSRNGVTIDKFINGIRTNVSYSSYVNHGVGTTTQLKINVSKNNISCYVNTIYIVSGIVNDQILQSGGIGIQVWDPTTGVADIDVKNMEVYHL